MKTVISKNSENVSAVARFFSEATVSFSLIGYLTLGCGVLLLIGFYAMNKGVYYRLKMDKRELLVDPAVLRGYVGEYWKHVFPEHHLTVDVQVTRAQKLEMFVEFPLLPPEKQQAILEQAEPELSQILEKRIGYKKDFAFSVLIK